MALAPLILAKPWLHWDFSCWWVVVRCFRSCLCKANRPLPVPNMSYDLQHLLPPFIWISRSQDVDFYATRLRTLAAEGISGARYSEGTQEIWTHCAHCTGRHFVRKGRCMERHSCASARSFTISEESGLVCTNTGAA